MSGQSVAGDNSGKKDDDPLAAILTRLAAIEDMVRPLVPLADQVAAIETTVTEQGEQQQLLSAGLLRMERGHGAGRHPPAGGRRPGDDDDDDGFHTTHKLEFPKYDGVGDPLPWLNRCERYFRVRRTPEHRRVAYASFYLTDDAQRWYHRLELNGGMPPWPRFVAMVNKRFGLPLTDSPIGELALLRRDGAVDDFAKRFMALSCRDTAITEAHQVQLFIAGLRQPLRTDVALQRPTSLDDAVTLARAFEQRDGVPPPTPPPNPATARTSGRTAPRPQPSAGSTPASSAASVAKSASNLRRLSPAEVSQRRKDGQCFHCDEPFVAGHKLVCQQLFCIEVVDNGDFTTAEGDTPGPRSTHWDNPG